MTSGGAMTNNELVSKLRTASVQCDDMRLRDFGYLMKTASDAIERLEQYNAFWEDEANQAKAYLNELVPKWIPVTERLPQKRHIVLVYSKIKGVCADFISNDGHWYTTAAVTHWMSLPEPPKEGES